MYTNNSLKEYYIKLERMMQNAVNMITAINNSLISSATEISVDILDTDDTKTTVRIPSFLHLENRLEQLETTISNLFKLPQSGEAWFNKSSDMFKLSLVKSNNAPQIPTFNIDNIGFSKKENYIFKDLVTPLTYIRLNMNNLTDNINQILIKKMIIYDETSADYLETLNNYGEIKGALFNKQKGVDYEEYDSVVNLPIKEDNYFSRFVIEEIPEINGKDNPTEDTDTHKLTYTLRLNTLTYYDKDDSSIEYKIQKGDTLCLSDNYVLYTVKDVYTIYNQENNDDLNDHIIVIEEYLGHVALTTYEENNIMFLKVYNSSYEKYHYIDVPLEENPRVILFFSTIYNNVKSSLSEALHINLRNIYMKDENNNYILEDGNKIDYITYYDKYCKNIGDMLQGITEVTYPQLTNYTNDELLRLTDSEEMKRIVTNTLFNDEDTILSVSRINDHLIDDDITNNVISMHNQKNDLNSQLRNIQDNIDQTYSQLTTTDFSTESNVSQESLKIKLNEYFNQRTELEKQVLNIIDNINQNKELVAGIGESKYRIRGITNASDKYDSSIESPIISYLHENFGYKCNLIKLDVEYKYKSINKNSTSVNNLSDNIFTDWNKMTSIERERYLSFNPANNEYEIIFSNYNSTSNVIKWNQIDIPINQGEEVVIRVRYLLNIGQPFINLYTPWSSEIIINFPTEFEETVEISSIFDINDNDVVNAKFLRTLINDGYQEHNANKIIDNSQVFYHMPENIYSGYNTPENKLISLKDKLTEITNNLNEYKSEIDSELNKKYEVILEWDNNSLTLSTLTSNNIVINELINGATDSFIRKEMNLIIKNTGAIPIKLYSIFPGEINTSLLESNIPYYNNYIGDYDRVPMLLSGSSIPSESIIPQTLGQWIYFRQTNPFTKESLYYDYINQKQFDINNYNNYKYTEFIGKLNQYINVDNKQAMLPYRRRVSNDNLILNTIGYLSVDVNSLDSILKINENFNDSYDDMGQFYLYNNCDSSNNQYILKYEHLINNNLSENQDPSKIYLSNNISIEDFTSNTTLNKTLLNGAFLLPELLSANQLICETKEKEQYKLLDVGKSLSIPILFEYFLTSNETSNNVQISKTIAFDLKPSLIKDYDHYIIKVTAKYDYMQTTASVQNYSVLIDSLSE